MAPSKRRANILITVLWIIVTMSILVLGLNFEARSDVERGILVRERAQAYWYARAAVERAKFDAALADISNNADEEPKTHYNYEFEFGSAQCLLLSNSSKMSINSTDPNVWLQLFKFFGLDEQQSESLVDAVLDWRDEDDLERLNGAEDAYYEGLDPPYQPRNGPFHSIEELLLVRGITEAMFYGSFAAGENRPGLKDILTVTGPSFNRFEINSCPKAILMAFLEITEPEAQAFIEQRKQTYFKNVNDAAAQLPLNAGENLNRYFISHRSRQFSIKATGFVYNSPARYTVEDDVRFIGGGNLYMTLSHKDFSLEHVDDIEAETGAEEEEDL